MEVSGWDEEYRATTLAFIKERSQHYADKLNVSVEEILTAWEDVRNCAAVNYYQDANFPEITGDVLLVDSKEDFMKRYASKGFRCGSCRTVGNSSYECSACGRKSYGLLGPGKGATFVVMRPAMRGNWIFKPVAVEQAA
jgi:hypothetical protein